MSPVYRDHQQALRHRLDEARARVRELEARVTSAFWRALPREAAVEIARMRQESEAKGDAPEAIEALGRYADRLETHVRDVAGALEDWSALPADCPAPRPDEPGFPWGDLFGFRPRLPAEVTARLHARVSSITARLDRARGVEAFGRHGVLATMRIDGAPFRLSAVPIEPRGWSARGVTEVAMALRTSVRRGAGQLSVRPSAEDLHLLGFITRRAPITTGDPEFDAWFSVRGEVGAARGTLGSGTRAALRVVARDDVPTLEVGDGVAELRWRFEPSHATVRAALDALGAVRAAPPMPLLREPSRHRPEGW